MIRTTGVGIRTNQLRAGVARTGEATSDITPAGKIKPDAPKAQVFNLTAEGSQRENVISNNPKISADLKARLDTLRASERTAP